MNKALIFKIILVKNSYLPNRLSVMHLICKPSNGFV